MTRSPSQRGSAILMLFVALALFGALAFAFMRGSGNSTAMMTDEQAKVYAQQIIAYGNDVATAVKRLKLRGIPTEQINFYTPIYKTISGTNLVSNNPNSSYENQNIYSISGGGISPWIAPKNAMSSHKRSNINANYGHFYFRSVEIVGTTTSANDVVMFLEGVSSQVCKKINEILGVSSGWPPPEDSLTGWTGNIYTYTGTGILGNEASFIIGKKSFCIWNNQTIEYPGYVVLLINR